MNRQITRTILIIALIAWCLLPLFISCKRKEPRLQTIPAEFNPDSVTFSHLILIDRDGNEYEHDEIGVWTDIKHPEYQYILFPFPGQRVLTDNDWIKDHSEIKNLDE